MVLIAVAGGVVVQGRGFDFRLPTEIRAMADVPTQSSQWRVHECLLDLSHEMSFAESCVDRDRRPLIFVWGDSTAGALLPGLRKAQEVRDFGIAQFTSSSCIPALNVDVAGVPNCRAINDQILARAREINPDILLLHGAAEKYLDNVAGTVAALKKQTRARVVVLGPVPIWRRGLPNEVLRYFMLHHRLIPERSNAVSTNWVDAPLRAKVMASGAEYISVWDAMCNADGCLTRIGDAASDISASDQAHLTEKGSVFLVQSIIDDVLRGQTPRSSNATQ
ncbi:SGNH hydrolase domain-containing protein [Bradyrhizobium sp. URHD0069]|uniref:SGNH hydrolase domain-containing protein n=1 Tax=Bradyrhizobium sp. URHD0069 TaxID=1380355 RepID=UPI00068ABD0B|nr:SGNH hydrolase domain-containing protein [Bradyrhizobium sp. URHD0069]